MILAPHLRASSGRISGSGFESAKMIGSVFMLFTSCAVMRLGLLTPMKISAPINALARVPSVFSRFVLARGSLYLLRSFLLVWIVP